MATTVVNGTSPFQLLGLNGTKISGKLKKYVASYIPEKPTRYTRNHYAGPLTKTISHHRRRLHRVNRELCPGTHEGTGANTTFRPGNAGDY